MMLYTTEAVPVGAYVQYGENELGIRNQVWALQRNSLSTTGEKRRKTMSRVADRYLCWNRRAGDRWGDASDGGDRG